MATELPQRPEVWVDAAGRLASTASILVAPVVYVRLRLFKHAPLARIELCQPSDPGARPLYELTPYGPKVETPPAPKGKAK